MSVEDSDSECEEQLRPSLECTLILIQNLTGLDSNIQTGFESASTVDAVLHL